MLCLKALDLICREAVWLVERPSLLLATKILEHVNLTWQHAYQAGKPILKWIGSHDGHVYLPTTSARNPHRAHCHLSHEQACMSCLRSSRRHTK